MIEQSTSTSPEALSPDRVFPNFIGGKHTSGILDIPRRFLTKQELERFPRLTRLPERFVVDANMGRQFAAMGAITAGNWNYYRANAPYRLEVGDEEQFQKVYGELRGREIGLPVVGKDDIFFHARTEGFNWGLQMISNRHSTIEVNQHRWIQYASTHVHPGIYERNTDPNYYDKFDTKLQRLQEFIWGVTFLRDAWITLLRKSKHDTDKARMLRNVIYHWDPPSSADMHVLLHSGRAVEFIVVPPLFKRDKMSEDIPGMVYALAKRNMEDAKEPPPHESKTKKDLIREKRFLRRDSIVAYREVRRRVTQLQRRSHVSREMELLHEQQPRADLYAPYGIDLYVALLPTDSVSDDGLVFHRIIPSSEK